MNAILGSQNKSSINAIQKQSAFKKYRAIIISVALFILLDASVLIANFWLSFQIEKDATAVNIAGRQRMLSQRISKSLYDISLLQTSSANADEVQERNIELNKSIKLFDATINSFKNGGSVLGTAGKPVTIDALTTPETIDFTDQGLAIWSKYKVGLTTFTNEHKSGNMLYKDAELQDFSRKNNNKLLSLMNSLTTELAVIAKSKANLLRQIQVFGILLAFINFLIVTFHFLRKLGESDRQTAAAQQQTDQILETVDEGLFLVDKELTIGDQHSNRLLDIFGRKNIKGENLSTFLEGTISEKDKTTTEDYFQLLFDKRKKEKLIGDLNPLKEIPVQIQEENSISNKTKFLKFAFRRVEENGDISRILTTVSDITKEVQLREELAEVEQKNSEQMDLLGVVLNSNPTMMNSFLENAKESYVKINTELKEESDSSMAYVDKITRVIPAMHKIKGEADALKISVLADLAHKFETDALKIKEQNKILGQDFVPVTVTLEKMISYTESLSALNVRVNTQGSTKEQSHVYTPQQEPEEKWKHLYDLAESVAKRQNKKIEFSTSGLNDYALSESVVDYINTVATQLIRNSIVHGVEAPQERAELQKDETGLITLTLSKRKGKELHIDFKDDGIGLNSKMIREKAIESNIITSDAAELMAAHEVISLLFHSGFTTSNQVDQDHGHGVGMALVKEKTNLLNGKIRINTKPNQGTRFSFSIPLNS